MPAQLDFKAIAEEVDIVEVARHLGLDLTRDLRSPCPVCQSQDRAIEFIEDTNTFRCWAAPPPPGKKVLGGDCITLYAHVKGFQGSYRAAKELSEIFGVGGPVTRTSSIAKHVPKKGTAPPAREKATTTRETTRTPFDPAAFAEKLEYSSEVGALGYTEQEAADFGIGQYRNVVYKAARYASGVTAGYWKHVDGKWAAPKQWLPDASNVVQLKRA